MPIQPVAGFSPDQLAAFNAIRNSQGATAPIFDTARSMVTQSGTPINLSDVADLYNRMSGPVMANLRDTQGQQMQQATGNARDAAGGVGASRIGVTQANLAKQQDLATGQVGSGLYQQAMNAYLQQKQAAGAAGSMLGNLGLAGQGANYTDINALGGAGSLQQQLQQAQLNAPYQWAQGQFMYPSQLAQLSGAITGQMAPALGGTKAGATTYPGQSPFASMLGLGMAGAGALGGSGALSGMGSGMGSKGAATGSPAGLPVQARSGGRIGYADGGGYSNYPGVGGTDSFWTDLDHRPSGMAGSGAGPGGGTGGGGTNYLGLANSAYSLGSKIPWGEIGSGMTSAGSEIGSGLSTLGSEIGGGLSTLGEGAATALSGLGEAGMGALSGAGEWLGSLFAGGEGLGALAALLAVKDGGRVDPYSALRNYAGGGPVPFGAQNDWTKPNPSSPGPATPTLPPQASPTATNALSGNFGQAQSGTMTPAPATSMPMQQAPMQPTQSAQNALPQFLQNIMGGKGDQPAGAAQIPGYAEGGEVEDTFSDRFQPAIDEPWRDSFSARFQPALDNPLRGNTFAERFQPALDNPLSPPRDTFSERFRPVYDHPLNEYLPPDNKLGLGEKVEHENNATRADAGYQTTGVEGPPASEMARAGVRPPMGGGMPSSPLNASAGPAGGMVSNPWLALMQAGLGTMAASGKRDANGLLMSPAAALGLGGKEGVEVLQHQQEAARKERLVQLENQKLLESIRQHDLPYSQMTMAQKEAVRQHDLPYEKETVSQKRGHDIQEERYKGGLFDDETTKTMAEQGLAGDKSIFTSIARGVSGPQNLVRVRTEMNRIAKERGWSGPDIAAMNANFSAQAKAAGTAAVREANIQTAVNEAKETFPLAIKASEAVPRGKFVPVNKAIQLWKSGTSDPELGAFAVAVQGAMIAYATALSRTGVTTVHAQQRAEELLGTATSHEALVARLSQMDKEMDAALRAPETTRKAILEKISGKKPGEAIDTSKITGGGGATAPAPAPEVAQKKPPADRFNELIKSGKSKQEAYSTMKSEGY